MLHTEFAEIDDAFQNNCNDQRCHRHACEGQSDSSETWPAANPCAPALRHAH